MKLYSHPVSGHAHRAMLFLSLINLAYESITIDLASRQQKSSDFLRLNSFGQIPVLDDDDVVITDSNAILVYLAKKAGRTDWLPEDALSAARIQRWLSVAAGQIAFGPAAARLITRYGAGFNPEEVIARSHDILRLIEMELAERDWLVGAAPTIADVALYSYIVAAPEGKVDISSYRHIGQWLARIEALPGFVPFTRMSKDPVV